jgi:hypothetical protein
MTWDDHWLPISIRLADFWDIERPISVMICHDSHVWHWLALSISRFNSHSTILRHFQHLNSPCAGCGHWATQPASRLAQLPVDFKLRLKSLQTEPQTTEKNKTLEMMVFLALYIILYYIVLYYIILYCIVLCYIILYYIILYYIILCIYKYI